MHKPLVVYAQSVMKALQYLMWENTSMSIKVLEAVYLACKKAEPQALYHLAPVCLPQPCPLFNSHGTWSAMNLTPAYMANQSTSPVHPMCIPSVWLQSSETVQALFRTVQYIGVDVITYCNCPGYKAAVHLGIRYGGAAAILQVDWPR